MPFIEFIPLALHFTIPLHPIPWTYGPVFVLSHIAETTILGGATKVEKFLHKLFFGV